jgi:hypothetical protein
VYDIPLQVRYDVLQQKAYNIYLTAGLSSYIMKKEKYEYTYYYHNSWPQWEKKTEHIYTGNTHLFSVMNFSFGYERKISNKLSILGEPYLKLPLSGVGNGKVKLFSTGAQIGLKFHPSGQLKSGSR